MGRRIDLTGKRYERLLVLSRDETDTKRSRWNCICDCGTEKAILGGHLKSGKIQSCGCYRADRARSHGMYGKLIYRTWNAMTQRCGNKKCSSYNDYGGRGITVCDRWLKFENFYADMGGAPENMTLDRIDNNKGYSKENCKWSTNLEQHVNQRPQKNTATGIRGVKMKRKRFAAHIMINRKNISLGCYGTIEEATAARRAGELKYFGQYCPTE